MPLKMMKAEYDFDNEHGIHVLVSIIEPSPPRGAWFGNETQIRQWRICRPGNTMYEPCTAEEIAEFDQELIRLSIIKPMA